MNEEGGDPHFHSALFKREVADSPQPHLPKKIVLIYRLKPDGANTRHIEHLIQKRRTLIERLKPVTTVPKYYDNLEFTSERNDIETLYAREYIDGPTLWEWMTCYAASKHSASAGRNAFLGVQELGTWFYLARMLGEALRHLHDERLVHGDLRPDNIVLKRESSKVSDQEVLELKNVSIRFLNAEADVPDSYASGEITGTGTFRRKYDSPLIRYKKESADSPFQVMPTNVQWYAPPDIFSMGMILFELACGWNVDFGPFVEEERVSMQAAVRDNPSAPIWFQVKGFETTKSNRKMKNDVLDAYWQNSGHRALPDRGEKIIRMSEVILACLRSHTDRAVADLQTIYSIRRAFDISDDGVAGDLPSVAVNSFDRDTAYSAFLEVERRFEQFLRSDLSDLPAIVRELIAEQGGRFTYQVRQIIGHNRASRFLQIRERAAVVDAMVTILNRLKCGDESTALLTPTFFRKVNLGFYGRLTSALQLAALRGVQINWIILASENQLHNHETAEVLYHQREASRWLCKFGCKDAKAYGVYYAVAEVEDYNRILRNQLTSIFITIRSNRATEQEIFIAPDYHGEAGAVASIRIWPDAASHSKLRRQALLEAYTQYKKVELHLSKYYI